MSNEATPLSAFVDTVKRVVSPAKAAPPPEQVARDKAVATLRRELARMPASQRSRLSELSGLAEDIIRDFERGHDIGDTYTRHLVPYLFNTMALSDSWAFVNAPQNTVNWNVAPPPKPRDPAVKLDALADLLNESDFDHTVTLPEKLDVDALNLLSKLYSRPEEAMHFEAAGDGLVKTADAAQFVFLYLRRCSATPGFAKLVSDMEYTVYYPSSAARLLDSCSTDLASGGVYSRTPAGKWLAGREGANVVKWRSINEAMRREKKDHKYQVTVEIVKAQVQFVKDVIAGKASITVPVEDACKVVLARCRIV